DEVEPGHLMPSDPDHVSRRRDRQDGQRAEGQLEERGDEVVTGKALTLACPAQQIDVAVAFAGAFALNHPVEPLDVRIGQRYRNVAQLGMTALERLERPRPERVAVERRAGALEKETGVDGAQRQRTDHKGA